MEFESKDEGRTLIVKLFGDLDSMNTPELEQRLKKELPNLKTLEFDLKELDYVSSAGLRVFLSMQKKMRGQGSMTLRNPGEEVMEIFRVTGFEKLLHIVQGEEV